MFNTGTIYSNFTPLVKSPVIGYRISGEDVLLVLKNLTKRNFSKDHSIMKLVELHNIDGTILDKCNVVYFKSPNSFTGEDVCEIFIHGSPLIASQLEQLFKDLNIPGLRLAQRGEFSFRSVLNNKYSLKQAKAINLIINNESFSSLEYDKKILFEGDSVSGLDPLREDIVNLFSEITASIDFVDDEEFNFKKIIKKSRNFFNNCNKLLHKNRTKIEQKNICKVMLIGPVNVGKSTLFNKIIDKDRALSLSIILLNRVDFPTLTGPINITLQIFFCSIFVLFLCNNLLQLLKKFLDFFIIFLKLNSSSSTKSIDAVISENKFTISSLRGSRPLTESPSNRIFLSYSNEEKDSLFIIKLIALACLREYLLFKTERKENSPL